MKKKCVPAYLISFAILDTDKYDVSNNNGENDDIRMNVGKDDDDEVHNYCLTVLVAGGCSWLSTNYNQFSYTCRVRGKQADFALNLIFRAEQTPRPTVGKRRTYTHVHTHIHSNMHKYAPTLLSVS